MRQGNVNQVIIVAGEVLLFAFGFSCEGQGEGGIAHQESQESARTRPRPPFYVEGLVLPPLPPPSRVFARIQYEQHREFLEREFMLRREHQVFRHRGVTCQWVFPFFSFFFRTSGGVKGSVLH